MLQIYDYFPEPKTFFLFSFKDKVNFFVGQAYKSQFLSKFVRVVDGSWNGSKGGKSGNKIES